MAARYFKTLFCQQFNCPPSEYEDRAFNKLLYFHARPLGFVIRKLMPGFFSEDFKFIRYLGEAEDYREAANSVADFRDGNASRSSFLGRRLKIRVSGRAAGRLVQRLMLDAV